MLIDLHNHTSPHSGCSRLTAPQLIEAAMTCGLDAICVTDHHQWRGGQEAQALARDRYGFTVFRGVEVTTTLGDVLVFGLDEDFANGMDGGELLRYVDECGGATVLAHPFRRDPVWGFWRWLEAQGLALDRDLALRPELTHLHAIETFNGEANAEALAQAEYLALILGLPTTGGSDAHVLRQVGHTATEFARPVADERTLALEIRAGRIRPRRLR